MGYDRDYVFGRIGKLVKKANLLLELPDGFSSVLDRLLGETVEVFNSSDEDRRLLNMISGAGRQDTSMIDSMRSRVISIASGFITGDLRSRLGATGQSIAVVLGELVSAMEEAGDTVLEVSPVVTPVHYEAGNTGNGLLSEIELDQSAKDGNHIECVCIDDSEAGHERWRVVSSRNGYLGEAETDVEFDSFYGNSDGVAASGVRFTINSASGSGAADWALGDKVRFSTYVPPSFTTEGDTLNQFSGWKFFGVKPGYNTNPSGVIYVSIEAAGTPTTFTVNLYKDSLMSELVASGVSESSACTMELVDANGSGLSGVVEMVYSSDEDGITVEFGQRPRFQHFFVENFGVALPSDEDGSNTVSEELAE